MVTLGGRVRGYIWMMIDFGHAEDASEVPFMGVILVRLRRHPLSAAPFRYHPHLATYASAQRGDIWMRFGFRPVCEFLV